MMSPLTTDNPAWSDDDLSENPHENADKATRVQKMFSAIAPSYDLNNRVHSMGRDQAWRRAAVKMAELQPGDRVLDVACGTGDLTFAFSYALMEKKVQVPGLFRSEFVEKHDKPVHDVVGLDFTYEMLVEACKKQEPKLLDDDWDDEGKPVFVRPYVHPGNHNGERGCYFLNGDAMSIPFDDEAFDVVSIAFGIRNVADPAKAMAEFYRVLKPGGRLIVLEFSLPKNPLLLAGYNVYFRHIMPRTATLIARDKSGAYKYLPKSVNTFIDREGMQAMMTEAGFEDLKLRALTFGIAVCYRGVKRG